MRRTLGAGVGGDHARGTAENVRVASAGTIDNGRASSVGASARGTVSELVADMLALAFAQQHAHEETSVPSPR